MIEGAAIALVFLAIGYLGGRVRRKTPVLGSKPVKPKCACGHVRSMHVDGKGKCTEIDVSSWYEYSDKTGDDVLMHKEYPCACQLYDGPEPLPTYFAPEIQP